MNTVHRSIPPRLSTPIPTQMRDELKIIAVRRRIPMQQLVREILTEWLVNNRQDQPA